MYESLRHQFINNAIFLKVVDLKLCIVNSKNVHINTFK